MVACNRACCPKSSGGLDVINIRIQNQAMLLKFLDFFYNIADLSWVRLVGDTYYSTSIPHATVRCGSFWWKHICKLMPVFGGVSLCVVGNGIDIAMWHDKWNGDPFSTRFPCLFSYVREEDRSVASFFSSSNLVNIFHLPLSFRIAAGSVSQTM